MLLRAISFHTGRKRAERMVLGESWSEAGMCDVTMVIQLLFGWGGDLSGSIGIGWTG